MKKIYWKFRKMKKTRNSIKKQGGISTILLKKKMRMQTGIMWRKK